MKLAEFITALKTEIQNLVFPYCTGAEAFLVGFRLGLYLVKYGMPSEQQLADLASFGVISDDGEVNLDVAEQALLLGCKWPMKVGGFKVEENDIKKVFSHIRGK